MAKIDQSINLPQIFRDNRLSILPVSRSKYIIAPIDTHRAVTYGKDVEIISVPFLNILKALTIQIYILKQLH